VGEVLAPALDDPSLLEPIVDGRPDLLAQDLYAREHEWALSDEDVVRRRTTAWLSGRALEGLPELPRADLEGRR
jgi:glycerol-3-phosphate dehydrogenase